MTVTARKPVTYRRSFVDDYQPHASSLLPRELAEELAELGRLPWQLPARRGGPIHQEPGRAEVRRDAGGDAGIFSSSTTARDFV
ncbi:hypothetical protein [Roseateles aquatilis]|uniref:hypothetical protein n=1 Tax=Roseateles aquatilis TaxID=431061 RepID=UPI0011322327|nr:hypothetical protein [Roseateles aquatilis]